MSRFLRALPVAAVFGDRRFWEASFSASLLFRGQSFHGRGELFFFDGIELAPCLSVSFFFVGGRPGVVLPTMRLDNPRGVLSPTRRVSGFKIPWNTTNPVDGFLIRGIC